MAKIERLNEVLHKLKAMEREARRQDVSATVGYRGVHYAVYVHEDLNSAHAPGKQAKYLEGPARKFAKEIGRIVSLTFKKTRNLEQSLLMGALRLLRESQKVVPVDTGNLKAAGYAEVTKK